MSDQEYIKMILALDEEFFKGWEFKTGDQIINVLNNRILVILWETETYAWYYNYHPSFSNEVSSSIKLCEIRPIPSQEQLQNIIKLYFRNNGLVFEDRRENLYLEWRFEAWLRDQNFEKKVGLSFECLWLEFLMETVYEKRWNGTSWEKRK